jgi:hypothetical protein
MFVNLIMHAFVNDGCNPLLMITVIVVKIFFQVVLSIC